METCGILLNRKINNMINPTPWFERKFDFNFPVSLFPVITERLRGTVPRLQAMIQHIPDEKLGHKKDGKWSAKEIIGHLADLEELWLGRVEDFLDKKETLRAADLANTKTTMANHNARSAEQLIQTFATTRNKLLERVQSFDIHTASLSALHPRLQKPMRLVDALFFAAEHDDHELTKMRALLVD